MGLNASLTNPMNSPIWKYHLIPTFIHRWTSGCCNEIQVQNSA